MIIYFKLCGELLLYLQSICSLGVPFIFESPIIHSLILRFPSFSSLKTLNTETKN